MEAFSALASSSSTCLRHRAQCLDWVARTSSYFEYSLRSSPPSRACLTTSSWRLSSRLSSAMPVWNMAKNRLWMNSIVVKKIVKLISGWFLCNMLDLSSWSWALWCSWCCGPESWRSRMSRGKLQYQKEKKVGAKPAVLQNSRALLNLLDCLLHPGHHWLRLWVFGYHQLEDMNGGVASEK